MPVSVNGHDGPVRGAAVPFAFQFRVVPVIVPAPDPVTLMPPAQVAGIALALGGLVGLLLPGISAPPPLGAALMIGAGIAWGIYSLRGRGAGDPTQVTAGNFLRCVPFSAALSLATLPFISMDAWGVFYAVLSGAIASGVGYAIWYTALRGLTPTSAATVQLSVPLLAALGGSLLLGEALTLRLLLAAIAILGGIALVIPGRVR